MSETPRTDAELKKPASDLIYFARALERELTALRAALKEAEADATRRQREKVEHFKRAERLEAHDAKMERERNECLAVMKGLECYTHLLTPLLADTIRDILLRHELAEDAKMREALNDQRKPKEKGQ